MNVWANSMLANGTAMTYTMPMQGHGNSFPLSNMPQETEYSHMRNLTMNFLELPEMVIVDTRFITQKAALEAQIETVATLENEVEVKLEKDELLRPAQLQTTLQAPPKPQTADASCNTDDPQPTRERSMQTDESQPITATAAIQCNLEEDLEFDDVFGPEERGSAAEEETETTITEEENSRFLEYAKTKSFIYSNGKRECLICGEIKAKSRSMLAHMALHWGPAVLCFQCGAQFEHSSLLDAHNCHYKRGSRREIKSSPHRLFKCPHYRCSVVAISPLELYDHINEHAAEYLYRCTGCQRSFRTAGELRRHLPLRLQCLERAKRLPAPYRRFNSKADAAYRVRTFALHTQRRKRVLVKSFLSQRMVKRFWNSQRCCQICLKRCSNEFKFANHTKRCLKGLLYRFERKRSGETQTEQQQAPLLNGYGH